MKRITFALLIILTSLQVVAQELNYNDLKSITGKENFTSYVSKNGSNYKIGDTLKIGTPSSEKVFSFIGQDAGIISGPKYLGVGISGDNTKIIKIKIVGNKRTGYSVILKTSGRSSMANYSIDLENALSAGEIKYSGMTSDEALAELKKSKDKLDLGLISKEEYDAIKLKLSKYIK